LVSGWSDLGSGGGGVGDSGREIPTTTFEGGAGVDAEEGGQPYEGGPDAPAPPDGECTTATCKPGVCCKNGIDSTTSCTQTGAGPSLVALHCQSKHDCAATGAGAVCCLTPGVTQVAACATSCLSGQTLCDPAAPNECTAPQTCMLATFGLYTCK